MSINRRMNKWIEVYLFDEILYTAVKMNELKRKIQKDMYRTIPFRYNFKHVKHWYILNKIIKTYLRMNIKFRMMRCMSPEGVGAQEAEGISVTSVLLYLFSHVMVLECCLYCCVHFSVCLKNHSESWAWCFHTSVMVKLKNIEDKEKNLWSC